jgi:hypothetical protein
LHTTLDDPNQTPVFGIRRSTGLLTNGAFVRRVQSALLPAIAIDVSIERWSAPITPFSERLPRPRGIIYLIGTDIRELESIRQLVGRFTDIFQSRWRPGAIRRDHFGSQFHGFRSVRHPSKPPWLNPQIQKTSGSVDQSVQKRNEELLFVDHQFAT